MCWQNIHLWKSSNYYITFSRITLNKISIPAVRHADLEDFKIRLLWNGNVKWFHERFQSFKGSNYLDIIYGGIYGGSV